MLASLVDVRATCEQYPPDQGSDIHIAAPGASPMGGDAERLRSSFAISRRIRRAHTPCESGLGTLKRNAHVVAVSPNNLAVSLVTPIRRQEKEKAGR
jgi:hypothetical protein